MDLVDDIAGKAYVVFSLFQIEQYRYEIFFNNQYIQLLAIFVDCKWLARTRLVKLMWTIRE